MDDALRFIKEGFTKNPFPVISEMYDGIYEKKGLPDLSDRVTFNHNGVFIVIEIINRSRQTVAGTRKTYVYAPLPPQKELKLSVCKEDLVMKVGKLFGMQDIEIGMNDFDKEYIVKGSCETRINAYLAHDAVRESLKHLVGVLNFVDITIGKAGDLLPERVDILGNDTDILYFDANPTLKEVEELAALYELFQASVNYFYNL